MKRPLIFILFITYLVCSCTQKTHVENENSLKIFKPKDLDISGFKTIEFTKYSIQVPQEWKTSKVRGIDSYVTQLITSDFDTITSDLGWYSNELKPIGTVPNLISKADFNSLSETELIKLNKYEYVVLEDLTNIDLKDYQQTTEEFYLINGRKARIVQPKKTGKSYTGVYIANLWSTNGQAVHFNLYGSNLSEKSQNELLYAISTLKFK